MLNTCLQKHAPLPDQVKEVAAIGQLHNNAKVLLHVCRTWNCALIHTLHVLHVTQLQTKPFMCMNKRNGSATTHLRHNASAGTRESTKNTGASGLPTILELKWVELTCMGWVFLPLKLDDVRVHEQGVVDYLSSYVFLVPRHMPPLDKLYCDLHVTVGKSQHVNHSPYGTGAGRRNLQINVTAMVLWPIWL